MASPHRVPWSNHGATSMSCNTVQMNKRVPRKLVRNATGIWLHIQECATLLKTSPYYYFRCHLRNWRKGQRTRNANYCGCGKIQRCNYSRRLSRLRLNFQRAKKSASSLSTLGVRLVFTLVVKHPLLEWNIYCKNKVKPGGQPFVSLFKQTRSDVQGWSVRAIQTI